MAKETSAQRILAYRSGGRTIDPVTGRPISFANKKGVAYTELLIPNGVDVPPWARDRFLLAAEIERVEKRKDARFFKELELNLPIALPERVRLATALRFARREVVDLRGLIADASYHRYGARKSRLMKDGTLNEKAAELVTQWQSEGLPFLEEAQAAGCDTAHVMVERSKAGQIVGWRAFQPHLHLAITLRKIHPHGFDRYRESWLNEKSTLRHWRAQWAAYLNDSLSAQGRSERVDHRTLEEQRANPVTPMQGHPDRLPLPGHDVAAEYIEFPNGHFEEHLQQAEDVRSYNASLDIGGMVADVVNAFLHGGVVGAVETGLGHLTGRGILSGVARSVASVPMAVVSHLAGKA